MNWPEHVRGTFPQLRGPHLPSPVGVHTYTRTGCVRLRARARVSPEDVDDARTAEAGTPIEVRDAYSYACTEHRDMD